MKFSCFSSHEIRLLCFQLLALALSLLSTWVETSKITSKKTRLCCYCCFLSKSPGGHKISFQIKAWVAFGLSYLFIELFYIGVPVVWMDGRATVTWLQKFLGWIDYHIFLPMVLRFEPARASLLEGEEKRPKRVSRLRSHSWPASILHGETTGSVRDYLLYLVLGCSGPQDNLTVLRWAPTYKNQKERIDGILKTSMKLCRTAIRSQWGMLSISGVQAKLPLREK